jgi:hypothetical protein
MAWDTEWVLEGMFMFGAPLNIWKMEVYRESGGTPLSYYRIHMNLDNDPDLFTRLNNKIRAENRIERYPRLILIDWKTQYPHEYRMYSPWLYSLESDYRPSKYPYDPWKGPTLGVAFDKTPDNKPVVERLLGFGY